MSCLTYVRHGSSESARVALSTVHTVAEKCDCRRFLAVFGDSCRFLRQSHFSATVWRGLYSTGQRVDQLRQESCAIAKITARCALYIYLCIFILCIFTRQKDGWIYGMP